MEIVLALGLVGLFYFPVVLWGEGRDYRIRKEQERKAVEAAWRNSGGMRHHHDEQ